MLKGVQHCSRPTSASFRIFVRHSWRRSCPVAAPLHLSQSQGVVRRGQLHSVGFPLTSFGVDTFHMGFSTSLAGRYSHLSHEGRVVQCANPSSVATTAPSHSEDSTSLEVEAEGALDARIKKKVAMWVGYVGTRYKGLQIQRGPGTSQRNRYTTTSGSRKVAVGVTSALARAQARVANDSFYKMNGDWVGAAIEDELERAIYKAGGIIKSNFGNLAKISWTRSSRTDKGVHSLCTVISMKMEVPEAAWVNDMDGLALADCINVHLPQFIQVFGIVPVTRSFRARHDCSTRTYNYLLPAGILDIHPDTPLSKIEQHVDKFQSILCLFEGKHAYHNYTIRRLYRHFPQKPFRSRQSDRTNNYDKDASRMPTETIQSEPALLDEEDLTDDLADVLSNELADEMLNSFAEESRMEKDVVKSSTITSEEDISGRRAWWLPTPDESDKVWSSHFRKVLSCTCGSVETSGDAHFIRISITGSSFMVHQIRKMIGTAIAVFHGLLPRDVIPISLARHSRIVLPLAPPDGLILASNDFLPFRVPPIHQRKADIEAKKPRVVQNRENLPRLEMAEAIQQRVRNFCQDILMPEVVPLVSEKTPNWSTWMINLEKNVKIPESEMAYVRASWTEWREQNVRLRQMRNQIDEEWRDVPPILNTFSNVVKAVDAQR